MSKAQQKNTSKATLPKKTNVAMWWLILMGILEVVLISGALLLEGPLTDWSMNNPDFYYLGIGICFLYIFTAILIRMKTKTSWIFAIVISSGILTFFLIELFLMIFKDPHASYSEIIIIFSTPVLTILIPLILIIVDRKNYFKMVRQRNREKKDAEEEDNP